jgi:hypothetical protein
MKKANIVLIRMREARYGLYHLASKEARQIRAENYAHEFSENQADVANLLAQISRQATREGVRHG